MNGTIIMAHGSVMPEMHFHISFVVKHDVSLRLSTFGALFSMSVIIFTNSSFLSLNFPLNRSGDRVTPRFFNSACNSGTSQFLFQYPGSPLFALGEPVVLFFTFIVPVTSGSTVISVPISSGSVFFIL